MAQQQHNSVVAANRKQQVGSGMRGDKMRTYRFQDNTVTDHETGKTAQCDKVMKGRFELLW
jgi:protein subunit release factor A